MLGLLEILGYYVGLVRDIALPGWAHYSATASCLWILLCFYFHFQFLLY